MAGKQINGLRPQCVVCGRRAAAYGTRKGYRVHCVSCGSVAFFSSPLILERIAVGDLPCPHDVEWRQARVGWTRWCPVCRMRSFAYTGEAAPESKPESVISPGH